MSQSFLEINQCSGLPIVNCLRDGTTINCVIFKRCPRVDPQNYLSLLRDFRIFLVENFTVVIGIEIVLIDQMGNARKKGGSRSPQQSIK